MRVFIRALFLTRGPASRSSSSYQRDLDVAVAMSEESWAGHQTVKRRRELCNEQKVLLDDGCCARL